MVFRIYFDVVVVLKCTPRLCYRNMLRISLRNYIPIQFNKTNYLPHLIHLNMYVQSNADSSNNNSTGKPPYLYVPLMHEKILGKWRGYCIHPLTHNSNNQMLYLCDCKCNKVWYTPNIYYPSNAMRKQYQIIVAYYIYIYNVIKHNLWVYFSFN